MTLTPMATAPAASGPDRTARPARPRLTMRERREAFAQHRKEMTRLVTAKIDWVPVLVFASILMSPEARIDLSGFQLYPYRLALIASLPSIWIRLAKQPIRFKIVDALFASSAALMFIATALHYPLDVALKTGGANTFDVSIAYLVGRTFFRSSLDLRRFLYRITPILAAIALIMVAESISHRYIFRPIIGSITGRSPAAILAKTYEIRVGLLRATGPFLHPISAGIFFGSLAPLFIAGDLPKRRWLGLLACFGGIFGWSSAGLAALLGGIGLSVYDRIQARLKLGWAPVIGGVLAFAIAIEVLTTGGLMKFVIRYASLNPQTGYFRLLIWEYGWANVAKTPWIGIGYFESYERPRWMVTDSVDNFWLLHALRYGVPCVALMFASVAASVLLIARSKQGPELGSLKSRRMATGVAISIAIVYTLLLTSAPWGGDLAWLIVLIGMAVGMADRPRSIRIPT